MRLGRKKSALLKKGKEQSCIAEPTEVFPLTFLVYAYTVFLVYAYTAYILIIAEYPLAFMR